MSRADREHFDALRQAAAEAEAAAAAAEQAAAEDEPEPFPPRLNDESAAVDAYVLDLTEVDTQEEYDAFVAGLDAADRPVIFVVHGFNAREDALKDDGGFDQLAAEYEAMYGHLDPPPILVAVTWDSNTQGDYNAAERNAIAAGANLGGLLNTHYAAHGRSSPINVVAHSQGNVVVMEGIANFQQGERGMTRINSYIAVQAAVDASVLDDGGVYRSSVDGERVAALTITYADDWALNLRSKLRNYDTALGQSQADVAPVPRANGEYTRIYTVELEAGHHDYRAPVVNDVARQVFGPDGEGLGYPDQPHWPGLARPTPPAPGGEPTPDPGQGRYPPN